jgi:hypothetical protein
MLHYLMMYYLLMNPVIVVHLLCLIMYYYALGSRKKKQMNKIKSVALHNNVHLGYYKEVLEPLISATRGLWGG